MELNLLTLGQIQKQFYLLLYLKTNKYVHHKFDHKNFFHKQNLNMVPQIQKHHLCLIIYQPYEINLLNLVYDIQH